MEKDRIQLSFRVDRKFYDRIQAESVKRELTVQDTIINALKLYFQTPKSDKWDYAIGTFVQKGDEVTEEAALERQTWAELCWKYINQMPREKVELLINAVQWDLLMQKSSRRKGGPKKATRSTLEGS